MAGEIVFGLNAVREAVRTPGRVNRVYFAKESRAPGVQALVDAVRELRVPFDFVPQAKLNAITETLEHQGVAATISPIEYTALKTFLESCPATATVLALDQVQHPKNVGMMLRTAACAGAAGVLLSARGGALIDASIVRASAGTVLHVPVIAAKNLAQALRDLREAGFWMYALDASAPECVFDVKWAVRTAVVVGNESTGVRPVVRKACDTAVSIPLAPGMDSLNASVAAAVALFQIVGARRRAGQSAQRTSGGVA